MAANRFHIAFYRVPLVTSGIIPPFYLYWIAIAGLASPLYFYSLPLTLTGGDLYLKEFFFEVSAGAWRDLLFDLILDLFLF